MKVTFRVDGGLAPLPGLDHPVTFDTETLPQGEAAALKGLVKGALPVKKAPRRPPGPDARHYTIEVDDEGRHEVLIASDPVDDRPLAALVEHLRACARRAASR